ncbi:PE domain-containing protein [Mycobacterium lepromatosis]
MAGVGEVSVAIAALFSVNTQDYQTLGAQAATLY